MIPKRTRHRGDADRNARVGFPIALGVIYEDPAPTFESAVVEQNRAAAEGKAADLQALVARARPGRSKGTAQAGGKKKI